MTGTPSRTPKSVLVLALLLLPALLGMAMVAYATDYGPGVGGDATIYLTSAQNLLGGKGLGWIEADGSFRVLPYSPPLYPLVLSALGRIGLDMLTGARWLNVFLFGATVLMVGWQFYRASGRAFLAVLLGGLLATSPVMLGVQVWAMAESLTLFLGFAGLGLLLGYLEQPRRWAFWGSAIMVGLAFLTRYIAAAFVGTGLLILLVLRWHSGRKNLLRDLFLYGLVAVTPMLIWLVIDLSLTGTVGSRSAQPAAAYVQRFLAIFPALTDIYLFWLIPESLINRVPGAVKALAWLVPLAGLIGLSAWVTARMRRAAHFRGQAAPAVRLAIGYGLFILVYLLVLAAVQVLTYPPITLASRMLSPVHLAALVFGLTLLHLGLLALAAEPNRPVLPVRPVSLAVMLLVLALLGTYALRGLRIAQQDHQMGIGYTSPVWQDSTVIAVLKGIPRDIPIISNETTAIMFLTGRPAYPIQEIYQDQPLETFGPYGSGDDEAQRLFREQDAALVLFEDNLAEDFAMYGERSDERIDALREGLFPYFLSEDGSIYFAEHPAFLPEGGCLCPYAQ